jgi:DHA2 family multidrug resistance protein
MATHVIAHPGESSSEAVEAALVRFDRPSAELRRKPDIEEKYRLAAESNTRYRWLILVSLILAAVMEILDTTIVSVAQAQMAGNVGATTEEIAWVSTGYILANVIVLPMTAFLTARFVRRNYLTASMILFTVSSFFCGTSHTLGEIVVWRILQGAGGAALISTAQAALVHVFPPEEQAIVQPAFMLGIVAAPTLGPFLGGWLTDVASWNWCFFINIPIGIIAVMIVLAFLHDTEPARVDEPVDWAGVGLLAVGLGSLQYVLEEGERNDWFSDPTILRLSIVAGISLISLIAWQLAPRNTHPVIDLRVLKNASLSGGIVLLLVAGFGFYGVSYVYPLMAQTVQGLSPMQTGMAMLPGGVASAISIVLCGVITTNPKSAIDGRALTFLGVILAATGMWLFAHLSPASGTADTFLPLLLRGFALGFLFVPANTLAIGNLKPADVSQGVGLLGLARQLGGSIGIALIATYFDTQTHIARANLVGYLTSANPEYLTRVGGITSTLIGHGYSPAAAQQGALGLVDNVLMGQALMMAYEQAFLMLLVVTVITVPILALMRKPQQIDRGLAMH